MSESPESYWQPFLLPLRPCDIGDLTPYQLDACWDYFHMKARHGAL